MSLIKPLLHLKKLLGSEKNPGKMCNEIERKTTEWLETNPDSRLPSYVSGKAYILDKYLRELLSEKKSEEIAESINMELWRGIEKVKFLTIFNPIWEEGVANAVKDYFEKTPKERRVSIAKEINETIDKFVQELKQQNSK
jgi:ribosomal protein L31E